MYIDDVQQIRELIASIYWSLKKDHKALSEQGDDKEVYYDVGMIVAYSQAINKTKLADKIYDKFMDN